MDSGITLVFPSVLGPLMDPIFPLFLHMSVQLITIIVKAGLHYPAGTVDHRGHFIDICVGWPGRVHDHLHKLENTRILYCFPPLICNKSDLFQTSCMTNKYCAEFQTCLHILIRARETANRVTCIKEFEVVCKRNCGL